MQRFGIAALLMCLVSVPASAQQVEVEEFHLDNGMKFLLYPRAEQPNIIAAGWVVKVGSANERPGITGISHFFEHMMFKGTNTIGTNDPEADAMFRAEQKKTRDALMALQIGEHYGRYRAGEVSDPWNPEFYTPEMMELRNTLNKLMEDHKQAIVKDEFDQVYTEQGASGMNAFTSYDMTFYFINVPSNKFELWAWMESDRLSDSVFREFYSERDVVHEERRLRTESTPTGKFDEQFDAMFWQSSPYSWPVIGWTSDLNAYTMEQAWDYYSIYYQPSNIVGIVVGDFDPEEIKPVIRTYFGRLSPGDRPVPPVTTLEMPQLAEKRMIAECDCQPQIEVRYHTVPFGHKDSYPLEVLAAILNGRTGRLYNAMIEGLEIASSASAFQSTGALGAPAKLEGYFAISAQTKGDARPEDIEAAWYTELERLQSDEVSERELQKVKNQIAADSFRRLQSNFFLLVQLGIYEALSDWTAINEAPRRLQEVTAEDIKRVANTYFDRTNRSVALYYRLEGTGSVDPELERVLASVPEQARPMVMQQIKQLQSIEDLSMLQQILAQFEASGGPPSPDLKPVFDYMLELLRERVAQLESAQ